MTLLKQISLFTEDQLTSFRVVSLVSPIQSPEIGLEHQITDTSGRTCLEQFKKFNQVGLWAKTFAGLLIGMEGWYSTKCKLSWKLRATKSHRFYFQLVPSMLRTEGIEFGLLPTPKAMDSTNEGRELTNGKSVSFKTGVRYGISLPQMANNQMLPTPTASDKNGGRRGNAPRENHNPMTNSLKDAVNYMEQTSKCSQLNPLFVEEMMGFPKNWTTSPFQNGGKNR